MVSWLDRYYAGDITVDRVALCLNESVSFTDELPDITLVLHLLTDGSVSVDIFGKHSVRYNFRSLTVPAFSQLKFCIPL
jgi:hypothetical protein